MTVAEAIRKAERLLPGEAAPDDKIDPRWQAIIAVAEFIDSDTEAVWSFVERWGSHADLDVRQAIATCVLEHLLESHFDIVFARLEALARSNKLFAETTSMCWRFGQTELPENAAKLNALLQEVRDAS